MKEMTLDERMDYAAMRKKEMNCCQAVLVAFADKLGKNEDDLLHLGSGISCILSNSVFTRTASLVHLRIDAQMIH